MSKSHSHFLFLLYRLLTGLMGTVTFWFSHNWNAFYQRILQLKSERFGSRSRFTVCLNVLTTFKLIFAFFSFCENQQLSSPTTLPLHDFSFLRGKNASVYSSTDFLSCPITSPEKLTTDKPKPSSAKAVWFTSTTVHRINSNMILSLNNNNKKNHKHSKLHRHETWCMTNACCTNLPGNLIPFILSEPPIIQCWVMHKTCRAGARLAAVLWAPPITRIEQEIGGFVKIRPFKIRPGAVQWARQVRPEERNGTLWRVLVGLTLASVGCVEPGAIPGAHRGVYTRHSGRVELREFAALLEIEEFIVCVT